MTWGSGACVVGFTATYECAGAGCDIKLRSAVMISAAVLGAAVARFIRLELRRMDAESGTGA